MSNPLTNPLSKNNSIFKGPQYVDTAECRCALQENTKEAWRCIGNETADLYDAISGKWFLPDAGTETDFSTETSIYGGPPPNTTVAYLYSNDSYQDYTPLTTANWVDLPYLDHECNGQNDTTKTPIYYLKLANEAASGYVPQMCIETGAVPVQIQNASEWDSIGCLPGFYCQYNDKNLLPEYCPPHPLCQEARLAGAICPEPMGILEPIPCPAGSYCPNGTEKIDCPSGSYCPLGSVQPTACSPVSKCPAKSVQNLTAWPLVLLIALDILIIVTFITIRIINRKPNVKKTVPAVKQGLLANAAKYAAFRGTQRYQELDDDHEMPQMESNIRTVRRANTGFDAALTHENFRYSNLIHAKEPAEDKKDLHAFVQSLSKCLGATKFGLTFEFDQLKFQPKKAKKPILSEVTGFINSGSLWGVMGASGAGKSTFVNVLMGKTAHTGGVTKVNGVAGHISQYKKIIGYVPQDDVVSPELTVRENILHSARIRLPCTWSDADIQKHVDILISCLQLSHVTDSLVGSQTKPVISGGQRKRVSIGMELAAAPMALFLDEPTSGLDATSASSIMNTLKAISRLGITIVTIIHQPRREIFASLDSLILLAAGKTIYQGKEAEVKPYFEGLGYQFPDLDNPADVVGDIIAGEGYHYKKAGDTSVQSLLDHWHDTHERAFSPSWVSVNESMYSLPKSPSPSVVPISESIALQKSLKSRGAPWYKQIYFCFMRSMLQQWRLRSSFYSEVGVSVIAGFLIGLAMMKSKGTNFRGIFLSPYDILSASIDYTSVPQMALLVGLAIGLAASAPGVKIFGEEKLLYRREAEAGHNRFAYYIGKVISSFPRMILANLHFTVLFIVLATPRMSFLSSFSVNLMYFYCIYGLASCVSMITRREDGPLIATMTSLIIGVLNGMSPSLVSVTGWHMLWFWRICPGTWLAEAYFTENILPWGYLYQIDLAQRGLGYNFGQYPMDVLMLFALGSAYRVAAFAGLRVFGG